MLQMRQTSAFRKQILGTLGIWLTDQSKANVTKETFDKIVLKQVENTRPLRVLVENSTKRYENQTVEKHACQHKTRDVTKDMKSCTQELQLWRIKQNPCQNLDKKFRCYINELMEEGKNGCSETFV